MEKGIARTRYPLATTASSIESTIAMEFTERLCSLDIDTTTVPFTLGGNRADKAFTVHSSMNHGEIAKLAATVFSHWMRQPGMRHALFGGTITPT
jgi:hypothetical protein